MLVFALFRKWRTLKYLINKSSENAFVSIWIRKRGRMHDRDASTRCTYTFSQQIRFPYRAANFCLFLLHLFYLFWFFFFGFFGQSKRQTCLSLILKCRPFCIGKRITCTIAVFCVRSPELLKRTEPESIAPQHTVHLVEDRKPTGGWSRHKKKQNKIW